MSKITLTEIKKMIDEQKNVGFKATRRFLYSVCKSDEESLKLAKKIKDEK